jgi:hypothetical protein
MDRSEKARLIYRRQYLLAPRSLDCPFQGKSLKLSGTYVLYYHEDLRMTVVKSGQVSLVLLGDLFDYRHPEHGNEAILQELSNYPLDTFFREVSRCSGKHVIIRSEGEQLLAFTDLTAAKKVYYCRTEDGNYLASQPHLLARVLGFDPSTDDSIQRYYRSKVFKDLDHCSIGDSTYYDEILQLLPNHYLEIPSGTKHRFWPVDVFRTRPFREVAVESAEILKGIMRSIVHRYPAMLPVTAGADSRLILSGTRGITDQMHCYINRNLDYNEQHPDIATPRQLFRELGIPFHVHEIEQDIDEDFREVYFNNNPLAGEHYLPHIYYYYLHHDQQVNLPGNFASNVLGMNHFSDKNINPKTLTALYKRQDFPHALRFAERWLDENAALCREKDIKKIRLYYLEDRCANWMTQVQMEKEIAQDDINPLNCRQLVENFWSVHTRYTSSPYKTMNREVIKILWPDLLEVPINPGKSKWLKGFLNATGLIHMAYWVKNKTLY